MPWHTFSEYYNVPGAIGGVQQKISGFALGYNSVMGYIILAASILTCVLVFIPKRNETGKRILAAQGFMTAFISMIFLISGLLPIFIFDSIRPHIGTAITTLGCLIAILGVKKGINDFEEIKQNNSEAHDQDDVEGQEERMHGRNKV